MATTGPDRALNVLKLYGDQTARSLAERLDITAEGARQHLLKLHEVGLVGHRDEREKVGRPSRYWFLTAAGHRRFPDRHAELARDLVGAAHRVFGAAGIDRLVDQCEASTLAAYKTALADASTLEERVEALAEQRSVDGYMADSEGDGADGVMLRQSHCPIHAAARACGHFCQSELNLFRRLLGPDVEVERTEHILAGGRCCSYRIRAKSRSNGTAAPDRD